MNKINRIIAAVFFLVGLGLYLVTPSQVSQISTASAKMGADFFPRFVAMLMMFGSVGLFVQTQLALRQGHEIEAAPEHAWPREIKVGIVLAMLIVYVLAMPGLGFIVSSTLFGCLLLFLLGSSRWWYYPVYLAGVGVMYYVFKCLLYVHLPVLGVWVL
ncbi:MAG: tripartite tricarboxylate transporter TctB family protein [Planctomycetes bacterium]|nr:tripartite tricarboxylate transporter TctB family protein [Planctomycetota bacterium]